MPFRRTAAIAVTFALLTAVSAACSDREGQEAILTSSQTARVRFINALRGGGSVNVLVGNQTTPVASNVAFGAPGICITVPVGAQTLRIRQTGTSFDLATVNGSFSAGGRNTVVLFAASTTTEARVLSDDFVLPATGLNKLRLFNATTTATDVYFTEPTAPSVSGAATTVQPGSFSPTADVLATARRVRAVDVGQLTNPRIDFTLPAPLPGNRTGTVFLVGGTTSPTDAAAAFFAQPCPAT